MCIYTSAISCPSLRLLFAQEKTLTRSTAAHLSAVVGMPGFENIFSFPNNHNFLPINLYENNGEPSYANAPPIYATIENESDNQLFYPSFYFKPWNNDLVPMVDFKALEDRTFQPGDCLNVPIKAKLFVPRGWFLTMRLEENLRKRHFSGTIYDIEIREYFIDSFPITLSEEIIAPVTVTAGTPICTGVLHPWFFTDPQPDE
ncbi:E4 23K [bottlenose dolphin adenovirus 2]|uniref:E4 23K n=1 Tax=bottlenose dolphin adenovirus 2 TaxID=2849592 RepID=A0A0M4LS58_9ADEN|nr:E4 23K [Bottlenose dolphin adenovirus 1]ALE15317.1 E4 23K [Bottlenose dolphin adenovirus 1]